MIKAESTKSEELAKTSRVAKVSHKNEYWCHTCQFRFIASLKPGVDEIYCPKCGDDFCEIFTSHSKPNQFEPYQKPPKTHPRKIPKLTSQIVLMALAQLEYDSYAEKVREVKEPDLDGMRHVVEIAVGKEIE